MVNTLVCFHVDFVSWICSCLTVFLNIRIRRRVLFHFDKVRDETRWFDCSQLDKHNSKENNDIPRDKSRCNAPPDWLKTTIARIVPSLQLAQTEPLLHLTPYSYTFQSSIENFFAYAILRAALFSAASPAERLRSAGSLAITADNVNLSRVAWRFEQFEHTTEESGKAT